MSNTVVDSVLRFLKKEHGYETDCELGEGEIVIFVSDRHYTYLAFRGHYLEVGPKEDELKTISYADPGLYDKVLQAIDETAIEIAQ